MILRMRGQREYQSYLIQFFLGRWSEIAYLKFGLCGLQAEIEFPSDWNEQRLGWVRLGLGLFKFSFAFPWPWVSRDDYQCSGHTYGFVFFDTGLHLHWGKMHGKRNDPFMLIDMPWAWRHRGHKVITGPEKHPYTYTLKSGEAQQRIATITSETRLWTRPWFPWRKLSKSINIEFDHEVGERSGSWKGGVLGCWYEMLHDETPLDALRRMETERRFT